MTTPHRFAAVGLPAALVTAALFLTMQSLVAEEFTPEDTVEIAEFEINPQVVEQDVAERTVVLDALEQIETPPAPPVLEVTKTLKPIEPISDMVGGIPEFPKPEIPTTRITPAIVQDPGPLVRIPPQMPPRAERSGHCVVQYNVSAEGSLYDVQALSCSQDIFRRPSVRSVQKWTYRPRIQDGRPVGSRMR